MRARWRFIGLIASATALAAAPVAAGSTGASVQFHRDVIASVQHGAGWNEPSGIAGSDGSLWVSFQNSVSVPTSVSRSLNGLTWSKVPAYDSTDAAQPQGDMGDVTMTADRAGTIFLGHLGKNLQTDIYYSRDGGKTWAVSANVLGAPLAGGSSSSVFLVDRPWIASYSPDTNYRHTIVYLAYHDFVPSIVWVVTCSMATGSLSCGAPVATSNPQTACNSIPGGIAVAPPGSAHPGRVFVSWSTADAPTNVLSGCNITQLAPFYRVYASWSDTPSVSGSWHPVPVYISPNGSSENCPDTSLVPGASVNTCSDVSELFTPIAVDRAGNPYVAFIDYIDTRDKHYDMYLASSSDGGTTWDGKTDGSGAPALVDGGGTHFVANLVAGDSGRVALIYYKTSYADTPFEAGATCPSGVPPQNPCQGKAKPEPPSAAWVLNVSETLDAQSAHPSFVTVTASDPGVVTHYGDICNLGIYCDGSTTGNRSMYENTTLFLDRNGYLVAAWTDQRADPHLEKDAGAGMNAQADQLAYDRIWSTCQVAGPSLYAHPAGPTECGRVVTVASRSASRSARAPAQTAVATTSATLPATGGDAWLAVLGAACLGGAFVVARRVGRRS